MVRIFLAGCKPWEELNGLPHLKANHCITAESAETWRDPKRFSGVSLLGKWRGLFARYPFPQSQTSLKRHHPSGRNLAGDTRLGIPPRSGDLLL